jgi:hypothetical protein
LQAIATRDVSDFRDQVRERIEGRC